MDERRDDLTPEERVRRARKQRAQAAAEHGLVDKLVSRLQEHLSENNFAQRLYDELDATRRHA
jgi:hypothetical protein